MTDLRSLIKKNKPAVVSIAFAIPTLAPTEKGKMNIETRITGSGFLISPDGYVCTCSHLLQGGQGQLVVGIKRNGNYEFLPAKVIITDQERDIAIIQIPTQMNSPEPDNTKNNFPIVDLGISNNMEEGDDVFFIGFPFGGQTGGGFTPSTTHGIISTLRPRRIGNVDIPFFQIDALTLEGNSGAPLFDANGKIIGVINSRFDPLMTGNIPQVTIGGRPLGISTNIGFAIPIDLVKPLIKASLEKTA